MDTNLIGQSTTTITAGAAKYNGVYSLGNAWGNTNASGSGQNVMPVAGTLKNFYVQMDTADATYNRVFVVYKNGGQTSLAITLAAGVTSGSDTNQAHNVSYVAGDVITILTGGGVGTGGSQTGTGTIRWTFAATCAANTSMLLSGSGAAMGTTSPLVGYLSPQSANFNATTSGYVEAVMPTAGTIQNAYVQLNTAIAASTNLTFKLYKNGSPTSLTVVINTAVATGSDTNAAHAVTVAAGDRLFWAVSTSAVPATKTSFISAEFDPTINGESVHMFGGANAQLNTSRRYQTIAQNGAAGSSTEAARQAISQAAVWQKLYVYEQTSIATGSWGYTLIRLSFSQALTVTISSGQTGSDTNAAHNFNTNVGDTVSMAVQPTTTPTASLVEWGIVSYIAPSSSHLLSLMGVGT